MFKKFIQPLVIILFLFGLVFLLSALGFILIGKTAGSLEELTHEPIVYEATSPDKLYKITIEQGSYALRSVPPPLELFSVKNNTFWKKKYKFYTIPSDYYILTMNFDHKRKPINPIVWLDTRHIILRGSYGIIHQCTISLDITDASKNENVLAPCKKELERKKELCKNFDYREEGIKDFCERLYPPIETIGG